MPTFSEDALLSTYLPSPATEPEPEPGVPPPSSGYTLCRLSPTLEGGSSSPLRMNLPAHIM